MKICIEMTKMMTPFEGCVSSSASFVASVSKDVSIDLNAVSSLKDLLAKKVACHPPWNSHPLNPKSKDESTLEWIFLVDTLNFSFWTESGLAAFACEGHTGYWSLCAAVNRALREGTNLSDANVMANMTREQLTHIFRGDHGGAAEPPLLDERLKVMREAGRVLIDKLRKRTEKVLFLFLFFFFFFCDFFCFKGSMANVLLLCVLQIVLHFL